MSRVSNIRRPLLVRIDYIGVAHFVTRRPIIEQGRFESGVLPGGVKGRKGRFFF